MMQLYVHTFYEVLMANTVVNDVYKPDAELFLRQKDI